MIRIWDPPLGVPMECCLSGVCNLPATIIDTRRAGAAYCVKHAAAGIEENTAWLAEMYPAVTSVTASQVIDLDRAAVRWDLTIVVKGTPVGQGSKTRGQWGMYDDNAKTLKPWRKAVDAAARAALAAQDPGLVGPLFPEGTPVEVDVTFTFVRPKTHFGTGRNASLLKGWAPDRYIGLPDCDKALRAILDSLKTAGVYKDDRQADCTGRRQYTRGHNPHPAALNSPGALIRVRAVTP